MKSTLIFAALLAATVHGSALFKRQDPNCDYANVNEGIGPKIDAGIWYDNCDRPEGSVLDGDGQCPGHKKGGEGKPDFHCNWYCEQKRRYIYGQEEGYPQEQAKCNKEATSCAWSNQLSVTITRTWSIDGGLSLPNLGKDGKIGSLFSLGAGYSESVGTTTGTASSQTVQKKNEWCAYWTFIPLLLESCGTFTSYRRVCGGRVAPMCNCRVDKDGIQETQKDKCAKTPLIGKDGKAMGYSALVLYDCNDPAKLAPEELQDKIYLTEGVRDPNKHF